MKLNVTQVIKNLSGTEFTNGTDQDGKPVPLTLKAVMTAALLSEGHPDDHPSGAEKHARFKLATRIDEATDKVDIEATDVAKVKDLIGKYYSIQVVGRAWAMMEAMESAKAAA